MIILSLWSLPSPYSYLHLSLSSIPQQYLFDVSNPVTLLSQGDLPGLNLSSLPSPSSFPPELPEPHRPPPPPQSRPSPRGPLIMPSLGAHRLGKRAPLHRDPHTPSPFSKGSYLSPHVTSFARVYNSSLITPSRPLTPTPSVLQPVAGDNTDCPCGRTYITRSGLSLPFRNTLHHGLFHCHNNDEACDTHLPFTSLDAIFTFLPAVVPHCANSFMRLKPSSAPLLLVLIPLEYLLTGPRGPRILPLTPLLASPIYASYPPPIP